MKFAGFKKFGNALRLPTIAELADYLLRPINENWKQLDIGLTRLSFDDNFQTFVVSVALEAGAEGTYPNGFRDAIPTRWIMVRNVTNGKDLADGDTAWTLNNVYLKNEGASALECTVVFFR